jgi:hypothetical protein
MTLYQQKILERVKLVTNELEDNRDSYPPIIVDHLLAMIEKRDELLNDLHRQDTWTMQQYAANISDRIRAILEGEV